ncbi:Zn-ribbon domain-containing OB-fold protein [Kribbella speibonae]|uniref:Zn-ribbon domain-containing OB-fold protein n=1 Tax=Kribbella speibonae TaxID=1572660 RepID=A0A4V2M4M1_9ACTN|nr:Zn-ribbon domain-containing OB-fold protein [Kribbella speibonae]TCC36462.1 Zn-ribbon domain-containing OB-fold protein [Kribbella speibonae]
MTAPSRPVPWPDSRTAEFWEAAADGRLLVQACGDCHALQFYPRGHCVRCFGSDVGWREVSGRATLHTFSVVHRTWSEAFAADVPYVFAIVDLEEGVRMTSRVVDVEPERVRCDMPLQVVFRKLEDGGAVMPFFIEAVNPL